MRKLTVIPIFQESSFTTISMIVNSELPNEFVDLMKLLGGKGARESICVTTENKTYSVNMYLRPSEINTILQNWITTEIYGIIPFALEGSGLHICYSVKPESLGQILLTQNNKDGSLRFKMIFPSLEEYINSLITPDEFMKRYKNTQNISD